MDGEPLFAPIASHGTTVYSIINRLSFFSASGSRSPSSFLAQCGDDKQDCTFCHIEQSMTQLIRKA